MEFHSLQLNCVCRVSSDKISRLLSNSARTLSRSKLQASCQYPNGFVNAMINITSRIPRNITKNTRSAISKAIIIIHQIHSNVYFKLHVYFRISGLRLKLISMSQMCE